MIYTDTLYITQSTMENNIIECPHCRQACEIVELNCKIFRCGIMKADFKQIGPHLPKEACDALVARGAIYGCGKPFQLVQDTSGCWHVVICGYI